MNSRSLTTKPGSIKDKVLTYCRQNRLWDKWGDPTEARPELQRAIPILTDANFYAIRPSLRILFDQERDQPRSHRGRVISVPAPIQEDDAVLEPVAENGAFTIPSNLPPEGLQCVMGLLDKVRDLEHKAVGLAGERLAQQSQVTLQTKKIGMLKELIHKLVEAI